MVDLAQLNPLKDIGIADVGVVLLILVLSVLIVGMIGAGVWLWIYRKQLKYGIPLLKKVGRSVIRTAKYRAKDFKIGFAGDKLWYVPKAKKYIPVATLQTAPNEYTHFEREDGEWINVDFPDIDEHMKKAGVRYVNQDMRANRIAISNIIENRFKGKQGFWDKYGNMIVQLIFFIVVAVCMVIIFYQWSDIVDRTGTLLDKVVAYEQLKCPASNSLVPATNGIIIIFIGGLRRWLNQSSSLRVLE